MTKNTKFAMKNIMSIKRAMMATVASQLILAILTIMSIISKVAPMTMI